MKMEDIPEQIQQSSIVGEVFAWNLTQLIIEEIPKSDTKTQILDLIKLRRMYLFKCDI